MKTLTKFIFVLVLLLTASTASTYASIDSLIVTIRPINPLTVSGCDHPTDFMVIVKDTGSTTFYNDSINVFLDNEIYWTSATLIPHIHIADSTFDFPKFLIDSIHGGQTDTFYYSVKGTCNVIGEGTHTDYIYITYHPLTDTITYSTTDVYNILSPQLAYNSDTNHSKNMAVSGYLGYTFTRKFYYANTGHNTYMNGVINFRDTAYGSALRVDSIWAVVNSVSTYTPYYYNIDSSARKAKYFLYLPDMPQDDSLIIFEKITVIGCLSSHHDSAGISPHIYLDWGCGTSACQEDSTKAFVYPAYLNPVISFTRLNYPYDSTCSGTWKKWTILITQTSLPTTPNFYFTLAPDIGHPYTLVYADSITITTGVTSHVHYYFICYYNLFKIFQDNIPIIYPDFAIVYKEWEFVCKD